MAERGIWPDLLAEVTTIAYLVQNKPVPVYVTINSSHSRTFPHKELDGDLLAYHVGHTLHILLDCREIPNLQNSFAIQ